MKCAPLIFFLRFALAMTAANSQQLQPWLTQWHAALDPAYGVSPAEAIRSFLNSECQTLGVTRQDLENERVGFTQTAKYYV